MSSTSTRCITLPRLLLLSSTLLGLFILRENWLPHVSHISNTSPEEQIHHHDVPETPTSASCADVAGADNVMVLLKTGATELYQKLPTHFVTTFTCVPHYMIFSDLAQEFADYPVYDAIESISRDFRENHDDFELYRKLQQYQREGQDTSKLQGTGSWNLDKWKFLPMMHKAFTTAPDNIDWFLIIEADTSLSWTNLLQWLRTMDPKQPFYLGAQNVIGQSTFAHGGSGIVISRKAADMLEEVRREVGESVFDAKWEDITSQSCCGDEVISQAFLAADIRLTPAWPLIQGETVGSLDWTENHWCAPPITWHHVDPIEVDSMWQFESNWIEQHGWDVPYRFHDVFAHFIDRHVTVNRTNWNNLSKDRKLAAPELATDQEQDVSSLGDWEQRAVESQDGCAEACIRTPDLTRDCVQWMFSPGRCYLGNDIRFGKSDERESDHWTSGWIQERLNRFRERLDGCQTRWSG